MHARLGHSSNSRPNWAPAHCPVGRWRWGRAGERAGAARTREVSASSPDRPGGARPAGTVYQWDASEREGGSGRLGARHPRGRRPRPYERGVSATRNPPPPPQPGLTARAGEWTPLPPGSPLQCREGTRRAPHRGAALAPLPPPDTGRARHRARSRWEPARAEPAAEAARCGAPFADSLGAPDMPLSRHYPRYSASLPARSTFLPRLLPRLATSHGRGRRHPVPQPDQKHGICTRAAYLTENAGRSDTFHPFSVLRRRFSVICRYHNASLLLLQVSRGGVSIPLCLIPEQIKHAPSKKGWHAYR